jgi:hypothetical protein
MLADESKDEVDKIARLRRHLHAGGSTRLHEAAQACGLSNSELERWLADGRLRYSADTGPVASVLRCSVCNQASRHDLCDECRGRLIAAGNSHSPKDGWRRSESAGVPAPAPAPPSAGLHARGRVLERR